jgi:hypothetical protein
VLRSSVPWYLTNNLQHAAMPEQHARKRLKSKVVANMVSTETLSSLGSRSGVWTEEEDHLLYTWQQRVGNKWSEVARHIPGKNGQQCAQRWRHRVNPDIKRDKWTQQEDDLLIELVRQFGNHWAQIARHVPGRTDQQCMGRWKRHLDPSIKRDKWSTEEDILLCALYSKFDNQWSNISRALDGRTPQQCRTRWHNLSSSSFCQKFASEIRAVDLEEVMPRQELFSGARNQVAGPPRRASTSGGGKSSLATNKRYYRASAQVAGVGSELIGAAGQHGQHLQGGKQYPRPGYRLSEDAPQLSEEQLRQMYWENQRMRGLSLTEHLHPQKKMGRPLKGSLAFEEQQTTVRGRGRPRKQQLSHVRLESPPNSVEDVFNQFSQPMLDSTRQAGRSERRNKRLSFDSTVSTLSQIEETYGSSQEALENKAQRDLEHQINGRVRATATSPAPDLDAFDEGIMLPINNMAHTQMTPLKPSLTTRDQDSSGGKSTVRGTAEKPRGIDDASCLGLEYLTDEKLPGSKTPLSALKHAPKSASSPMGNLADLLLSPLVNKDQMRGMHALLGSPTGVHHHGGDRLKLTGTPESTKLMSDVVRCLDMSDATLLEGVARTPENMQGAHVMGGLHEAPAIRVPGTSHGLFDVDMGSSAVQRAFQSTPGSIGIQPPLVLDSTPRMASGSVMMKHSTMKDSNDAYSADVSRKYPSFCENRFRPYVPMPVYSGVGGGEAAISPAHASLSTIAFDPLAAGQLNYFSGGQPPGPGQFVGTAADKMVNKRRLSSDSVRMCLHALLDNA